MTRTCGLGAVRAVIVRVAMGVSIGLVPGCRLDDTRPDVVSPGVDAGSGADGGPRDAGSGADSGVVADGGTHDAGSGADGGTSEDGGTERRRCVVTAAAEFGAAGSIAVTDAVTGETARNVTSTFHDAVVRPWGSGVAVLNRLNADNVQLLDPARGWATRAQLALGAGTNPWDLLDLGDGRAWIAAFGDGTIVEVVDDGAEVVATGRVVSLAPWADADGRAEPVGLVRFGDAVFVLLAGLVDQSCPAGATGRIVALDAATMAPVARFDGAPALDLARCNLTGWVVVDEGVLVVATAGRFQSIEGAAGAGDGGIERVDLRGGRSLGVVLDEGEAGDRDLFGLIAGDAGRLWTLAADAAFSVEVRPVHLPAAPTGRATLGGAVFSSVGAWSLREEGGVLWIADRTPGRAGLVRLDAATGARRDGGHPIPTGHPPADLLVVETPGPCPGGR